MGYLPKQGFLKAVKNAIGFSEKILRDSISICSSINLPSEEFLLSRDLNVFTLPWRVPLLVCLLCLNNLSLQKFRLLTYLVFLVFRGRRLLC